MTTEDGYVVGSETVVGNGPAELLLNIVLVAEGFREGELPEFAQYAQRFADRLLSTAPFNQTRCGLNIFRIDVVSRDSGADDPLECGGNGFQARTYFDASFCAHSGVRRAMSVDEGSVINVVRRFIPQWGLIIVVVNSPIWGGTGGQIAKTSVPPGWENIAIHEMGHSLFGLADEYEYLRGCGQESDRNEYPSFLGIRIEPGEPNVTIWTDRNGLKWRDLVAPSTPIPTTNNADCTQCDPQGSPVPFGTVGTFEGAATYHCRVYRPEFSCMMRTSGLPFCAVCTRTIRRTMDAYHSIGVRWIPLRFIRINDYAVQQGFVGGYPNFHEADYGLGVVFGSILLRRSAADWRDVSAAELGNPSSREARFTAVHDYAVANGYVGGYPNFHEADYGQGLVYGCILIKPPAAEWRDVFIRDLCGPSRRLNDAQFVSQSVPSQMVAGQLQSVTVRMRNIGTATWTSAGSYRLGSQRHQDNTRWGFSRVPLPGPVTPGSIATFTFTVTPPGTPGRYDFQWRMVQDMVDWFGDFSTAVSVLVVPPGPPVPVPDVREMLEGDAAQTILDADLVPRFTGSTGQPGAWVWSQSPSAGVIVDRGSTVTCQLRTGEIP